MDSNWSNRLYRVRLVLLILYSMLVVALTACGRQSTDQIRPNALTIVIVDGLEEVPHFPDEGAIQSMIDGMRQAASDLNIDLIFQSETAFDTVQFFLDSLRAVDIDGIVYAQAYDSQVVDGIDNSIRIPVPVIAIDLSQDNVNLMEPLVNITATASITAQQVLDYMQSQQLLRGLCIIDTVDTSAQRFNQLCQLLQRTTVNSNITFNAIEIDDTLQNNAVTILNDAIDQHGSIDTLLFHSIESSQRYVQRVSSDRRESLDIATWTSVPYERQELVNRGISFIVHEDFFAKGYLAILHLSLYVISGQVAGVGLRNIESGSHIFPQ